MKNRKLLSILLSVVMMVTILPLSVFAEESEPLYGSSNNPFEMTYWRNHYYCDIWADSDYAQKEIWVKLETRSETELAFEVFTYSDVDLLRSATMYDSDQKTVVYKFDYNDDRCAYETEKLNLNKQTYYFKLKFSEIPREQGYSLNSIIDETTTPAGTFEDPVIVKADKNTAPDEFEDYYTEKHFYLKADTKSVYYRIDAFKTEYYNLNIATFNEVGVKSIKLLDDSKQVIDEFERLYFEGAEMLPEDYANYSLKNYKLEKDNRYYIEVIIDKSVEFDPLELGIFRLDGNGLKENPFNIVYLPSEYSEWYYGYGTVYKNQNEYWFKATIAKDTKNRFYAGYDMDLDACIIDSATIYINGDKDGIKLTQNKYGVYCIDDYIPVKKDDVVLFKLVINDNAKVGNVLYTQMDCFGMTDNDVTLSLSQDQYTWDGKEHKPTLAYIKYKGVDLIPGTDYDSELQYSNTTNIGYSEVGVVGMGEYQGMRFLDFRINPIGTKLNSVVAGSKSVTIKWKKQDEKMSVKRITGYEIQYSTTKKFTGDTTKTAVVKGYKNTNKTIKKLKKGKKYFVRIRTYYYDEYKGENVYSSWSTSKAVTLK